jgi:cholesterol oxidase
VAVDWPGDGRLMQAEPAYAGARRELVQWLQGGHATRKRPLDRTYLHDAVRHGAEIRPLHEVELIEPQGSLYRVTFRSLTSGSGCGLGALRARRVVLAAGTLGTVRLLLSCRDRAGTLPRISDRLGQRFFTNGDFGALIMRPQLAVDAGPPATAWIDLWKTDRLFVMDTGLVPLGAVLGWPRSMGPAWSLAVMGYDDNPGRLRLSDGGALVHEHQPSRGAPFHERRLQRLREVAAALEGRLLAPPSWLALRLPVTFHPLGGAALAQTPSQGVTDPYGEVFGHPGLYVADGSLMPTPLGAAPSMTIAALAEVVVEHLLRTW